MKPEKKHLFIPQISLQLGTYLHSYLFPKLRLQILNTFIYLDCLAQGCIYIITNELWSHYSLIIINMVNSNYISLLMTVQYECMIGMPGPGIELTITMSPNR